jgi:DNA-binding MarR family transcriptional regulator
MTARRAWSAGAATRAGRTPDSEQVGLAGALRQAWVGYRRRLDAELAKEGFDDRGFPDGRVLRRCGQSPDTTASDIGRELGISRQGAGKIVTRLRDRGYVTLDASPTDGREKHVHLTARAVQYLEAQRRAARRIERELHRELGGDGFDALQRLLSSLGGPDQPRMRDDLQRQLLGRATPSGRDE